MSHVSGAWEISRREVGNLEIRESNDVIPIWNSAGLRSKKRQLFSLNPKAGKDQSPSSSVRRVISLLLSSFVLFWFLIGWGTLCFTQSTGSNVNFIQKYPHLHTRNNVWPNVWASYGLVRLMTRNILKSFFFF